MEEVQWVGGGAGDESHHKEGKEGKEDGKESGRCFPRHTQTGFSRIHRQVHRDTSRLCFAPVKRYNDFLPMSMRRSRCPTVSRIVLEPFNLPFSWRINFAISHAHGPLISGFGNIGRSRSPGYCPHPSAIARTP